MSIKAEALKEGDAIIRKRTNRQIRSCGGCKSPISVDPITCPYDAVICKKEIRPKRGCSWSSLKKKDFALSNVHYHIKRSCLASVRFNHLIVSQDVELNSQYLKHFKDNGVNIP